MSSYDSISKTTKDFLSRLNVLLRETGHYMDFTNGALFSLGEGYIAVVEDNRDNLLLVEEESGEILYESENNNQ